MLSEKLEDTINKALLEIGDYGEVRLVVRKGKVKFIVVQTSEDVSDLVSDHIPENA